MNELSDTGRGSGNCVGTGKEQNGYARWRGLILGYCLNCAMEYGGDRGLGFYSHAVESCKSYRRRGVSAFDTYLKGIDLETLGDISFNPEDTMENHNNMKDDIIEISREIEEREQLLQEEQEEYFETYSDF